MSDPAAGVASSGDSADTARIIDQGYRSYDGPRTGLPGAVRSVVRYSVRHTLGLGRPARHKILPWLAVVIALVPAVVFVGLAVVLNVDIIEEEILPDYHEYYGFITTALFFYCGIVVPDILVSDRRNGMLPLYLSTPLERWSYLTSKALAVALTLAVLTAGPVLFLLVAYTIEGSGPDGLIEWLKIFVQIIASGAAISAAFTAASLAAASLTDRRAFASVGVILLLWGSGFVTLALVEAAEMSERVYAFDLGGISDELKNRIYSVKGLDPIGEQAPPEDGEFRPGAGRDQLSTMFVAAANLGWVGPGIRRRVVALPATGAEPMSTSPPPPPLPPNGSAMVEVNGVSKVFGDVVAVSDVSFSVRAGVTALLGPNGAGKSTLFRLMCGLTPPSKGTVRVLGADARRDRDVRGRIGLAPQQDGLFDRLSALQFVSVAAATEAVPEPERAARRALGVVNLDADDSRSVSGFSKGMRQRVKLAAALVHDPEVLILDEPLTGLDPVQRRRMIELFHGLGDEGRCVLVSSHVLEEVARLGSRILMIAQGRLAATGDYRELRELMDDRPHRIRVSVDRPRQFAAALVESGTAVGVSVGQDSLVVDTRDVDRLGREVAPLAQRLEARLSRVAPLDEDLESVFRYLVEKR